MEQFTNLYQLVKTLRFGLEPVGETKVTFEKWIEKLKNSEPVDDEDGNLFVKDERIRDAYLAIKPIMDRLHEKFIEESLTSNEARKIDFSEYFEAFKDEDKDVSAFEKKLRLDIGATYVVGGRYFSSEIEEAIKKPKEKKEKKEETKDEKTNKTKKKQPYECLTDANMLDYLSANVKKLAEQNGIDEQALSKHIEVFKGFWGYMSGYNQNRKNYYEVKKKATTAVATRIVHENLPIFCNNIRRFEKCRDEYIGIYQLLKDNNRETKIKNSHGVEVEAEAISEDMFQIAHFNNCLSQTQIDEYNRVIGDYNYMINLYKQARSDEKNSKKIDEFERLKKQIGCGKKKSMFVALIKDRKSELKDDDKKRENEDGVILTVETLLQRANIAGEAAFNEHDNESEINSIPGFIRFLKGCNNWSGIYMSKNAINKISSLYFANWHSLEEILVEWHKGNDKELKEKVKACITYDEKREEPLKLRDAVELSGLFAALDTALPEHFFKESLFKDDDTNEYRGVLDKTFTPSENLINMLCFDMKRYTEEFLENSKRILVKEKYKDENIKAGEEDQTIKEIKDWFDAATDAMRIVRYFAVRKSKMKGNIPNATMEQALSNLLYSDEAQWFKWYDLIRNYLTKKPQADVKENRLKLNFNNPTLMEGWDLNKESNYATVILRKNGFYYIGIMAKGHNNKFDEGTIDTDGECYEKMIYKQIPMPMGVVGFVRKCAGTAEKYGWHCPNNCLNEEGKIIGKDDEAHTHLKEIIDCYKDFFDKYEKDGYKYRDFNFTFLDSDKYEKLSDFFRDVEWQSYKVTFRNVSVVFINDKVKNGELYLFKLVSKDFSPGKNGGKGTIGTPNLQTLYWKKLFDEDNLKDVIYKLNGESEIFMRKPVAKESPVKHVLGSKLVNKRDKDDKTIPEQIYREIFLYENKKKKNISDDAKKYIDEQKAIVKDVKHEIVKDNRFYGETKYLFHCPITINFKAKKYKEPKDALAKVNEEITNSLQQSVKDLHFIGIDRGEKHLVYSCTIDENGKIIEGKCHDHDNINGTNYVQKLEAIADERTIARKNWQQQSKIKDLKRGYLSHVVHNLVEETIKDGDVIAPHAYIVLEDLSTEMKRGRQKIEKQVYQLLCLQSEIPMSR